MRHAVARVAWSPDLATRAQRAASAGARHFLRANATFGGRFRRVLTPISSRIWGICDAQRRFQTLSVVACGHESGRISSHCMSDVTQILNAIERGDPQAAAELLP